MLLSAWGGGNKGVKDMVFVIKVIVYLVVFTWLNIMMDD